MSWVAIAKKDIQDSIRAKTLWAIIGVFFLAIGGLTYLAVDGGADALEAVFGTTFILGIFLFIPITGLLISIKSIVGERESGTINLLLSLPHSRKDMVTGKFVGRSVVMAIATVVGFVPAIIILLFEVDEAGVADVFMFTLVAVLMALMFVGIGVGFSALVNSETQATVGGIAVFFMLYLWFFILNELSSFLDAELPDFVARFWLFIMFNDMVEGLLPDGDGLGAASLAYEGTGDPAFFMQNWFAFVILALWTLVPLAIGYARFKNIDL
jgi:ABC-2 type transport system permease protein